jgi:hypothetical protein
MHQGGVFRIQNVPQDQIPMVLGIGCPNIVFPYLREAVSDVVIRAGFPPLLLNPVNFEALFQQQQLAQQQQAAPPRRIEASALKKSRLHHAGLLCSRPAGCSPWRTLPGRWNTAAPGAPPCCTTRLRRQAGKVAIAGSGLPLEVVVDTDAWVKVRDHSGRLAWIEKSALGGARSVMVKSDSQHYPATAARRRRGRVSCRARRPARSDRRCRPIPTAGCR